MVTVIYAFLIFCLLASAVYLINDINDRESDRKHPSKKNRPLASGQISLTTAVTMIIILLSCSLAAAYLLNQGFFMVCLSYLCLMLCYTFLLKNLVILDVFSIAAGFVLRAVAGVVAISVALSPWLVICTILLSLFIGLSKRRHELITVEKAAEHRQILNEYSPQLLDQLIAAVAGSTIVAYALYTLWPDTIAKFETPNLVYSVPFVLYGIFRYLYLIYQKGQGGKPEEILLTDRPLIIDIIFWLLSVIIIISSH